MDSSAYAWAAHECSSADFHDARLTKRFMAIAASFLQHSQSSIPQACRDWPAAKAAYRFFSNSKVQSGVMLEAHQTGLMDSVVSLSTILVAQDTTALNLSNKDIAGLGSIGDGGKSGTLKGLYVHSGLVMTTAGIPLGLSYQKIYTRDAKTKTEAYRKKAKSLPITEKETGRWIEAIERTKQVFATQPHTNVVVVGDRESDIYEVFQKGRELGMDLLVRTSSNRNLANKTDGSTIKLFDKVKAGTVVARYKTAIPIDHRKTRAATLTIRTSGVELQQSQARRTKNSVPISLTVLNITEENPKPGIEPIHWMLTTTLTVTTAEEAIEKVLWYMYRWRIERFHYTLKTGAFNIEKLQFETLSRFAKAITMYSLIAVRILHSTYYGRDHPAEDASSLFSKAEIEALLLRIKKTTTTLTIHEAVQATAQLGGHLGRKSDGSPGIKTLWQGFKALQYLVEGIQLARSMNGTV